MAKFRLQAPHMVARRKELRNRSTLVERILWKELRKSKLGYKFIRQYSVDNYVIDFYCPSKRIAVELDGKIHLQSKDYDNERSKFLEAFCIKVIRFRNEEVFTGVQNVLNKIRLSLLD